MHPVSSSPGSLPIVRVKRHLGADSPKSPSKKHKTKAANSSSSNYSLTDLFHSEEFAGLVISFLSYKNVAICKNVCKVFKEKISEEEEYYIISNLNTSIVSIFNNIFNQCTGVINANLGAVKSKFYLNEGLFSDSDGEEEQQAEVVTGQAEGELFQVEDGDFDFEEIDLQSDTRYQLQFQQPWEQELIKAKTKLQTNPPKTLKALHADYITYVRNQAAVIRTIYKNIETFLGFPQEFVEGIAWAKCRQFIVDKKPLDFSTEYLSTDSFKSFEKALTAMPTDSPELAAWAEDCGVVNLSNIRVDWNFISYQYIGNLLASLNGYPRIQTLNLCLSGLSSGSLDLILEFCTKKKVVSLGLARNPISDAGIVKILNFIKSEGCCLKTLDIGGCDFSGETLYEIGQLARQKNIKWWID